MLKTADGKGYGGWDAINSGSLARALCSPQGLICKLKGWRDDLPTLIFSCYPRDHTPHLISVLYIPPVVPNLSMTPATDDGGHSWTAIACLSFPSWNQRAKLQTWKGKENPKDKILPSKNLQIMAPHVCYEGVMEEWRPVRKQPQFQTAHFQVTLAVSW